MTSIRIAVASCFAASLLAGAGAQEPPTPQKLNIVTPMTEGLNAVAINARGHVVGFHLEPENGDPNVLYEAPFLAKGTEIVRLPLLKTYTATFPAAVSDDDMVVGRVGKAAPPGAYVHLRNQAFVWTEEKGIRGLGTPEPDGASLATGVSRDGRRIAGIGAGDNRLRAVLWEADGDDWKAVVLPDGDQLGSNVLAVSPDGKRLAAVRRLVPTLWTETEPGRWRSESLSGEGNFFIPRAVNDAGTVVGFRNKHDGTYQAVVWTAGEGVKILTPPPGFQHAQATAVNNAGAVVGQIDGPNGELPGPRAFLYEKGELRPIDEGGPDFVWATAINDARQVSGILEEPEMVEENAPPTVEATP